MSSPVPAVADAEIAAAVFAEHLARVERGEQAREHGWVFTRLGALHAVATVTGVRPNGVRDVYNVKLGAEFYDLWPPTTAFVCPSDGTDGVGWKTAGAGSRWLPDVQGLDWFAIHPAYQYQAVVEGAQPRTDQLVCCSMTFEYYITGHSPTDGQKWQQGRHTLGATLNRIQDALTSGNYRGPSGALDS